MDQGFRFLCQAEARRLLFLIGITVALVISIQYFEFPSTRILSLFGIGNSSSFFPRESSSIDPDSLGKVIVSNNVNSTVASAPHDTRNSSEDAFAKKETTQGNGSMAVEETTIGNYVSERTENSINKSGVAFNESILVKDKTSENSLGLEKAMAPDVVPVMNVTEATASAPEKVRSSDTVAILNRTEDSGSSQINSTSASSSSSASKTKSRKNFKKPSRVVPILQMNDLLRRSHASSLSVRPQHQLEVDRQLLSAKSQIENAPGMNNDSILYAPIYRNASMFKRSYELMEEMLKVYIYQDGKKPIFHQSILEGIYASEGWFIKLMEANKKFVTKDPKEAHLFYIPFSSRLLELTLYVRKSHSRANLVEFMKDYVNTIAAKYSFWNRTSGADHFVVACHDWAPTETRGRMLNCIRALCNADIEVGFSIGKDVSLPETYVRSAQNPLKNMEGNPPSQRSNLAFFAGNVHGYVRPILLEYWENKDPDMKIFGPLPHVKGNRNYIEYMKSSKFCICPRGHEVNSPRIVEAIFYECVPVIISDNYVPPFFEVLDWESFAVFVLEEDIPKLKNILLSISEERYVEMHKRVKKVQQHFLWHPEPVKYDLFHMILHSVWYNRVFQNRGRAS